MTPCIGFYSKKSNIRGYVSSFSIYSLPYCAVTLFDELTRQKKNEELTR